VGISDTTDTSSSLAGADYVLQLDLRFGAEQGQRRARSALQNIPEAEHRSGSLDVGGALLLLVHLESTRLGVAR
jgi:hypothetical protein